MSNKRPLYIPIAGPALLETALLNKGSAFSSEERDSFNLTGLLPHNIETIEEQSLRAYHQLRSFLVTWISTFTCVIYKIPMKPYFTI